MGGENCSSLPAKLALCYRSFSNATLLPDNGTKDTARGALTILRASIQERVTKTFPHLTFALEGAHCRARIFPLSRENALFPPLRRHASILGLRITMLDAELCC